MVVKSIEVIKFSGFIILSGKILIYQCVTKWAKCRRSAAMYQYFILEIKPKEALGL
jgi:hypothetical protein